MSLQTTETDQASAWCETTWKISETLEN